VLRLLHAIKSVTNQRPVTKNRITKDSPDYQLNKNRVNNLSSSSPSHSNHGSP